MALIRRVNREFCGFFGSVGPGLLGRIICRLIIAGGGFTIRSVAGLIVGCFVGYVIGRLTIAFSSISLGCVGLLFVSFDVFAPGIAVFNLFIGGFGIG